MGIFIVQLLTYAWCRIQNINTGYEITHRQAEQQKFIAARETLRLELARLKSPDRIARIAKEQLGLVSPTIQQMVDIE